MPNVRALSLFPAVSRGSHRGAVAAAPPSIHALTVRLDPATSLLDVSVEVTLPEGTAGADGFLLSAAVKLTRATPAVEAVPLEIPRRSSATTVSSGALDPTKGPPLPLRDAATDDASR